MTERADDPQPGEPRMLEGLDDLRATLDELDRGILKALIERDRVVAEVARRKVSLGASRVRDPVREEQMLARLSSEGQEAGLDGFYVGRVFRELLDHSVRMQQELLARSDDEARERELVVAYQGIDGAYSHLAAMRHFGPRGPGVSFRGYPSFRAMMEAVRDGDARYGVLPIENTTAGSINDAYDLLAQMDLSIVGEELQRVEHCLVAIEPVPLSKLRRVFSHPQALAQCSSFLASLPDCHAEAFTDTAMAVQRVAREQDVTQAAIASEDAARRYGLMVIRREIANQKENYTRMVVVAARPEKVDPRVAAKTSLVLAMKHEQGALLGCLGALAQRGLNLTKLESRPRLHTPWEYLFYLDFEGNLDDAPVQEALSELRGQTSFLRVLGSYPARLAREVRGGGVAPTAASTPAPRPATSRSPSARAWKAESTTIAIGGKVLGGARPLFLAKLGRHASREALLESARALARAGADVLRVARPSALLGAVGAPYADEVLRGLEEVAKLAGIALAIEVSEPEHVERAARRAELVVVPSVHMRHEALLAEVGRLDRPLLLERDRSASLDEWLAAADVLLSCGNHRVALGEVGTRSWERPASVLDLAGLPLLTRRSHLPVVVDPSGTVEEPAWTLPLVESAFALGAHAFSLPVALGEEVACALPLADFAALVARLGARSG